LEAQRYFEEALQTQTALGSARRTEDLNSLAEVSARLGKFDAARSLIRESLALSVPLEDHSSIIRSLEISAYAFSSENNARGAAMYLATARQMRAEHGYRMQALRGERNLERHLREGLGSEFDLITQSPTLGDWRSVLRKLQNEHSA
jgi:hypothetical protein